MTDWDSPAPTGADDWGTPSGNDNEFTNDTNINTNGEGSGDNACRNCGQEGHFSRDCPEPKKSGACFNCGQEGHSKTDCPNPKAFTGTCRICEKEGHPAALCPDKPPEMCRNCGEEGHKIGDCEGKRALNFDNVPEKSVEEAWKEIVEADNDHDLEDLRIGVEILQKADRNLTYAELENGFRERKMNTYLIAVEKDIGDTFTLMDLDGRTGRKYTIGYQFSQKPSRPSAENGWPKTPEENTERLQNAGLAVDSKIPKCGNCGELGHIAKSCKEEKREREKLEIKCVNCGEVGHRVRDCTQERVNKFACRNCKKSGHNAKECPEPRSAEGVECKNCNKMGHFSRDCPDREREPCRNCGEEGHRAKDCPNPRVEKCRNCDEVGHISKECPKPRDWSRVKCSNCGEMGHGRGRCKAPPKDEGNDAFHTYGDNGNDINTVSMENTGSSAAFIDSIPDANDEGGSW